MANKIYINPETSTTWRDTGGDLAISLSGLAADAVRVGAVKDLGAGPRASWYSWRVQIDGFGTAPVVGETVDVYLSTSSQATAGMEDGDVGVADAAGVTAALPNLLFLGSAVVQTTTTTDELTISGVVQIVERYVMPVVHNNAADAMGSTTPTHQIALTPIPDEVQ